jgi:hypothetical protein
MHVMRNAFVVAWWLGLILLVGRWPALLFTLAVILMIAGPWLRRFNRRPDSASIHPPIGVSRYSTVCTMSWLTVTKAAIGQGLVTPNRGGMAEQL